MAVTPKPVSYTHLDVYKRQGQIQILQFRGFHSCPDSGGQHINALIHTFIAYDLWYVPAGSVRGD